MNLTEEQKNCPYCHGWKRLRDYCIPFARREILEINDENSLEYTLVLPNHKSYTVQTYITYCPECGRNLLCD